MAYGSKEYTFHTKVSERGFAYLEVFRNGYKGKTLWLSPEDVTAILSNGDKLRLFLSASEPKPLALPDSLGNLTPEQKETVAALLAQKQATKASVAKSAVLARPTRFVLPAA